MLYEEEIEIEECLENIPDRDLITSARHKQLSEKNRKVISSFLGKGQRAVEGMSTPWYYRDFTAWMVKNCLTQEGWKTISEYGYIQTKPVYRDIETGYDRKESCLISGQMLVERGDEKVLVTVDLRKIPVNYVQVEVAKSQEVIVRQLIRALENSFSKQNFYFGQAITLAGDGVRFIKSGYRMWDSIILDPELKETIRRHTVEFLRHADRWTQHGIPVKRGIILAGKPGTGKTVICKALMSEAKGITCLLANAYSAERDEYFANLYSIAQDLAPCIVFIEDLDLVGQERIWGGYHGTPQLIALLAEMDGITEKDRIVTVATTNNADTLDEALSKRPGRFERVINILPPSANLRALQIETLMSKIPLSNDLKDYLVRRTEGFSPAQVQETVFGLVINNEEEVQGNTEALTQADVDRSIMEVKHSKDKVLGFNKINNVRF